jgi:hypothetical protein
LPREICGEPRVLTTNSTFDRILTRLRRWNREIGAVLAAFFLFFLHVGGLFLGQPRA